MEMEMEGSNKDNGSEDSVRRSRLLDSVVDRARVTDSGCTVADPLEDLVWPPQRGKAEHVDRRMGARMETVYGGC